MAPLIPHFRAITPADQPFLQYLYATTRAAEMAQSGWPQEAIASFLRQQFDLQQRHYQQNFPDAEHWLLERAGQPIGRLYLHWETETLRIIDIALLPNYCGQGLGSVLLNALIARADEQGLSIDLHVEAFNPAQRLYQRLGFEVQGETGLYLKMQRPARGAKAAAWA